MQAELEKQLRNLKINVKKPENSTNNIVLYPRGVIPKVPIYVAKQQIELDKDKVGPKPIDISKFCKNKTKKNDENIIKQKLKNVRGGKKHQLQKDVNKFKELIKICVTDEEKEKYNIMLNRCKNELNRLRKGKKF